MFMEQLAPAQYVFFINVPGMFNKVNHMMDHKTSLNKFQKIEILQIKKSEHNKTNQKLVPIRYFKSSKCLET